MDRGRDRVSLKEEVADEGLKGKRESRGRRDCCALVADRLFATSEGVFLGNNAIRVGALCFPKKEKPVRKPWRTALECRQCRNDERGQAQRSMRARSRERLKMKLGKGKVAGKRQERQDDRIGGSKMPD